MAIGGGDVIQEAERSEGLRVLILKEEEEGRRALKIKGSLQIFLFCIENT